MDRCIRNHNINLFHLVAQPEIDTDSETRDRVRLQPHIRQPGMTLDDTYSHGLREAVKTVMNNHGAPRPPYDSLYGQSIRDLLSLYDNQDEM